NRFFHVYLSSAVDAEQTVRVHLELPKGLKVDSISRSVTLPPLGSRSLFFRLQGELPAGQHDVEAVAELVTPRAPAAPRNAMPDFTRDVRYGVVAFDYTHIPTQRFYRESKVTLQA